MARKKSPATLLKEFAARVAELEKKLSNAESIAASSSKARMAAEAEVESIHVFLDAMESYGAPPRTIADKRRYHTGEIDLGVLARLATYFAWAGRPVSPQQHSEVL